jgi:polysaccharide biosynthesis/export protein
MSSVSTIRTYVSGLCFLVATACGSTGPFTWARELPPAAANADQDFLIRDTDTVNVRVYQQDAITTNQRVRPDGRIVIPLAGEFMARGKKPALLAKEIEDKLKGVLVTPVVTVSVEQSAQITVSVVGQVKNAGAFSMDPGANVLQALASAGGLSDYASEDRIFVLRRALDKRVRFTFAELRSGDKSSIGFGLHAGDVVVVE